MSLLEFLSRGSAPDLASERGVSCTGELPEPSDPSLVDRALAAKKELGSRLMILGHHYQRDEVIRFADITGDSFKLAQAAAANREAELIVFCGVHFMAESADILDDGRWSLASLRDIRLDVDPPVERALARSTWSGGFSREQTETLIVPVEALVLGELQRYIAVLEDNGVDSHRHRVLLWQQFASPLGLLGMALLGMPLLLEPSRGTPIATRAALGAGAGILFFLAERLCGQGAILYRLPPAPAALAPGVIVLLMALWLISRAEGHHGFRHALQRLREGRR